MRMLVLGAGAVGGYFGGRLAEAGRDVTFLVRPVRAALLHKSGLAVASPLGDFRIPVQTATADQLSESYDVVLLTAKHYGLDEAIEAIRPAVGEQTSVLPLLNGLVHLDQLDAAFGSERVLGGVAYVGAALLPDGSVRHHNRFSALAFGDRSGSIGPRVRAIAQMFEGTPVTATPSGNILLDMWEKFVMLATMAGMNCLMRGNIGEIADTEDGSALMRMFLGECQAVATASGYATRSSHGEQTIAMLTRRGSIDSASMRTDLNAGGRTEADWILGDMRRRALALRVPIPLLSAAYCHLQVHENRLAAQSR
jgi:2-dehydropantoate 2-reductase